jgi:CheY-like chemotaxis protein
MLARIGYAVTTCGTGEEALAAFRRSPREFDIVITDMTMPKMTGDKLAVEILKIRPDIPIVLCTGYSAAISSERAAAMGIKAFLYKPVVEKELRRILKEILDQS